MGPMNEARAEELVRQLLIEIGENAEREGLKETPARVIRMYKEIFAGLMTQPPDLKVFTNEEGFDQLIVEKDIPFYSCCEHHLVPFFGKAHIGYLPNKHYLGLSKLARLVDYFAKRPQIQERLTMQVANYLYEHLRPNGVIVVIEAEHLCVGMRGIKKPRVMSVTSALKGDIDKAEFLDLLNISDRR